MAKARGFPRLQANRRMIVNATVGKQAERGRGSDTAPATWKAATQHVASP